MRLTYDAMTPTLKAAYRQATSNAGYRYSISRMSVSLAMRNSGSSPARRPTCVR